MSDAAAPTPQPASPPAEPAGYPRHWEADVVLRDGGTARVRPILPGDADRLQAFHVRQSERSTYFRFFAPLERLPERDLSRFTQVDHHDRVALVAVADEDAGERIIAVARYDRTGPGEAEVAFNVADDHHGRGLGSVLLEHIAAAARERGIRRFTAEVLPQNGAMLAVFRVAGYAVSQHLDDGIVTVSVDLDPTERSLAVMADREHRAEARSVRTLLTPRSVLVVTDGGAETRPQALAVVDHLLGAGAPSDAPAVARPAVHAVGLGDAAEVAQDVPGAPAVQHWPDVAAVPGPVDLLVLAVAAEAAAGVVRRCARLGAHAVVVLSRGFAETGPDGLAHQRDLVHTAHGIGMRVLGPASFGFFRHGVAADEPTVNASLTPVVPQPGRLALFCQSAPLAVGMLASARRRGLGLSTFVSSGNRADVSGNDLMQFWTEDEATSVVGLYLESIGNPRKFTRVARRLAAAKPVVVLTAGRSGHVVPAGHAVRSTRVPRRALDEILRQAGVVRVDSQHQLLDVAQLLVHQPVPAGRRVAVLTGSESLAALVAEAAASAGLTVVDRRAILAAGESDEEMARLDATLAAVYADQGVDAVVVAHVPTLGAPDPRIAAAVARAAAGSGRTTVACVLGLSGVTAELTAPDADGEPRTVPAYAAPEDGVVALAAAARHAAWRGRDHGQPLDPPGIDRAAARRLVLAALEASPQGGAQPDGDDGGADGAAGTGPEGGVPLDQAAARELLACYGIPVWPTRRVHDEDEAVAAAEELGWPVALKSTVAQLRHRIDLGGVRLDVAGPVALREALAQMKAHLGPSAAGQPFEVQAMARNGAACVVRTAEDPRFGPVISFGLAGDAVDLLGDVAHAVAPLTDVDVADMVRSVRTSARLFGYRGLPALDVAALEDVLGRVSVLADDLPEVRSLELHPVVVAEQGVAVLAARVELGAAGRADGARRALPQ
ncbi:GNAT family N-acetyltransferase [Actinotalea solisilvae]|uniref:GNAT family N-acetyltransferase n=1 Tax=Actinotalea solisilvae TaxID=2072922 RepID=UPI0018F22504|nr:GNAT family N-acetyltransferase [Actinotalea solisilvae]